MSHPSHDAIASEGLRLTAKINEAIRDAELAGDQLAAAERNYRKEVAQQWEIALAGDGLAKSKEAAVAAASADARYERDHADLQRINALEAQRSYRAQLEFLTALAGMP